MTPPAILLVDDEPAILRALTPLLRAQGYHVETASTGAETLRWIASERFDLVVLDLGLPDGPGTEVCRAIRRTSEVPIIILSARTGDRDKVVALDLGADDYVTKPFSADELLARIRVALRRQLQSGDDHGTAFQVGELSIDRERRRVIRGNEEIRLTPKEFELLSLLAKHQDRVVTHQAILKAIWGPHAVGQPEHLWVLVAQLRKKLEVDPAHPRYVISEPWVGYRLSG